MDFFRILVYNNVRSIPETTVSSLLNYFLNPNEDHGFRYEFLALLLERLDLLPQDYARKDARRRFCRERPDVQVESEYKTEEENKTSGRIDSYVTIGLNAAPLIIGTEVKVHNKSVMSTDASGRPQLQRYAVDFAAKARVKGATQISRLLFVIPGSHEAIDWARRSLEPIDDTKKARDAADALARVLLVVPWTKVEVNKQPWLAPVSMEEILSDLLREESNGDVSPADPHAVAVLRSLRNAAMSKFNFDPPRSSGPRSSQDFPDEATFYEALGENSELLDCIRDVVSWYGCNIVIRKGVTSSAGIPMGEKLRVPGTNHPCAIHKVAQYGKGEPPLTTLRIGLDVNTYNAQEVANLPEAMTSIMASKYPNEISPISIAVDCGENFHPNKERNRPIHVIDFKCNNRGPKWQGRAKEWCRIFLVELRRMAGVSDPEIHAPEVSDEPDDISEED